MIVLVDARATHHIIVAYAAFRRIWQQHCTIGQTLEAPTNYTGAGFSGRSEARCRWRGSDYHARDRVRETNAWHAEPAL